MGSFKRLIIELRIGFHYTVIGRHTVLRPMIWYLLLNSNLNSNFCEIKRTHKFKRSIGFAWICFSLLFVVVVDDDLFKLFCLSLSLSTTYSHCSIFILLIHSFSSYQIYTYIFILLTSFFVSFFIL